MKCKYKGIWLFRLFLRILVFVGAGFFIVVIIVVVSFVSCEKYLSSPITEKYLTYEAAVKNKAVERGWIPSFVPKEAYDIQFTRYYDHNYTIDEELSFRFFSVEPLKYNIEEYSLGKIPTDQIVVPIPNLYCNSYTDYYHMPDFDSSACLMVNWLDKTAYFISRSIKHGSEKTQ